MHENNEALYVPLPGGPIEDFASMPKVPTVQSTIRPFDHDD